jgi:hypothetical protein
MRDVVMEPGRVHWLPAQTDAGENTGATPTHVLFVELKETGTIRPDYHGGASHASPERPPPPHAIGPSKAPQFDPGGGRATRQPALPSARLRGRG